MIVQIVPNIEILDNSIKFVLDGNVMVLNGEIHNRWPTVATVKISDKSIQKLKNFLSISDSEKIQKITEFIDFSMENQVQIIEENKDIGISPWNVGYLEALNDMKKIIES